MLAKSSATRFLAKPVRGRASTVVCSTNSNVSQLASVLEQNRRSVLLSMTMGVGLSNAQAAWSGTDVGSQLPSAGVDDLVVLIPDAKRTPSLRAGVIDSKTPYKVAIPPTWKEGKIANIASGNFCMPNCGEPWTEVLYSSDKEGKLELIAAPLVKLTNKSGTRIEKIGSPEAILQRIGAYITGTYLDDEDVVSVSQKQQDDGLVYYYYEIYATYGTNGPHTLTAMTTKGDVAYMFVVSANDKQWPKNEEKLRKVVEFFRA